MTTMAAMMFMLTASMMMLLVGMMIHNHFPDNSAFFDVILALIFRNKIEANYRYYGLKIFFQLQGKRILIFEQRENKGFSDFPRLSVLNKSSFWLVYCEKGASCVYPAFNLRVNIS